MFKICNTDYVINTRKTQKIIEHEFQDMSQKVKYDENPESLKAHFLNILTKNQVHNSAVQLLLLTKFLK